ncbi:MAG: hypothetical protein HY658_09990 [Actinobacteria bacterium]|nr:hypothetical protein [Actinomycetota bacterium]
MRVEFYRSDDPDTVAGVAAWDGRRAAVEADDDGVREAIARLFRPAPVVVDDASLRSLGSRGVSVLQPGSLQWFRAAALTRAAEAGLVARVVPGVTGQAGWDPAAAYRSFRESDDRIAASARPAPPGGPGRF